jgi:SAM-dependent methyltransferase
MASLETPARLWAAGLRIGAGTLSREPVLGLKRLILPVSYWRTAEFGYVARQLRAPRGSRVFDLGSPKDLAVMLARSRGYEVVATDILPEAVALSARYARAQGLEGQGPGRVRSEVHDGRSLPFPDASFDAAFSVSVLEHIPDDGDAAAIRELVRIVRPGGHVVLTVPFDLRHRETWVDHDVYERERQAGERVFFERHYDRATLDARLVGASGAVLEDLQLWGEGRLPMERLLQRLGRAEVVLSPLHPLFAALCLRPIRDERDGRPMAAFLSLRKPGR